MLCPTDRLDLIRSLGCKTEEHYQGTCITEGLRALNQGVSTRSLTVNMKKVVSYIQDSGLRLLLSNKEGSFVV